MERSQLNARAFAVRAAQQHEAFFPAAYEFENREAHERHAHVRCHSAAAPPARPAGTPHPATCRRSAGADRTTAAGRGGGRRRRRAQGHRHALALRRAAASASPSRRCSACTCMPPIPFLNGAIAFSPDPTALPEHRARDSRIGAVRVDCGRRVGILHRPLHHAASDPAAGRRDRGAAALCRPRFPPQSITLARPKRLRRARARVQRRVGTGRRRRSPSAKWPKRRCGSSSPTPATSCARR